MVCYSIGQFISFLVEKAFENICNLESIYMEYGNADITISEKLIGVSVPLIMNEKNAILNGVKKNQISQNAYNKFKHLSLVYY